MKATKTKFGVELLFLNECCEYMLTLCICRTDKKINRLIRELYTYVDTFLPDGDIADIYAVAEIVPPVE